MEVVLKPISPCTKDCPDRASGCTKTCTRGYAKYEEQKMAFYKYRNAQKEIFRPTSAQARTYRRHINHPGK